MDATGDGTVEPRPTIYNTQPDPEGARVNLRRLPSLTSQGLRLLWMASRRDLVVSMLLQLFGGVGIAAQLLVGQRALRALLGSAGTGSAVTSMAPWAVAVAAITAAMQLAAAVQRERQQLLGELVRRHVEGRLLEVARGVDLLAFDVPAFHNRLERVRSNSHQPPSLVFGVTGLAGAAIGVLGVVAALVTIEPILLPLVAVVFLPAWLAASRRSEAFFRFFWRFTPADRERQYLAGLLTDRETAKEVRGFGLGPHLRRRYDHLYEERIAALRQVSSRQLRYTLAANLGTGVVLAGTLLLAAWLTLDGRVTLAQAGVAVAGLAVVGARLTQAGYSAAILSEAGLYLDDYHAFLDLLPRAEAAKPSGPAPDRFRRLTVDKVTFTYPSGDQPALRDVSLHVDEGEVVALVGENGSGKTTLAKLLAGLYTPQRGRICWDGTDIATVDPDGLRRSIAVIFQDFVRYHLPAADNIGLGRPEAVDDLGAIRVAARQAGADGFLVALPMGYRTILGPEFLGGTDLSIGQWQRVALARAFYRDAPFVILDEPTASLDPRAERELFQRIRTLLSDRTVLLISHRFSSVRSADRIYVLADGRIIEHGTHHQLMDQSGLYAELFALQADAYLSSPAADRETPYG